MKVLSTVASLLALGSLIACGGDATTTAGSAAHSVPNSVLLVVMCT